MKGVSEKDREEPITEWREDEKGRSMLKKRSSFTHWRGTASSTVGGALERAPPTLDEEMEGKACVCFHMQLEPHGLRPLCMKKVFPTTSNKILI